jgi:hypothetical protein
MSPAEAQETAEVAVERDPEFQGLIECRRRIKDPTMRDHSHETAENDFGHSVGLRCRDDAIEPISEARWSTALSRYAYTSTFTSLRITFTLNQIFKSRVAGEIDAGKQGHPLVWGSSPPQALFARQAAG